MSNNFGRNNPDNEQILRDNSEGYQEEVEQQEVEQQEVTQAPVQQAAPASKEEPNYQEPRKDIPNMIDGYVRVPREEMPHGGKFYPPTWEFVYRCPTAKEVVTFSTLDNDDTPNVYIAVEDLIKKCVRIYDTDLEKEVASIEINDGDRTFFMLKLREFYIADEKQAVKLHHVCQSCFEEFETELHPQDLIYDEPNEALLEDFDGRIFHLDMGQMVEFRIPTISTTGRFFRHMVQVIRDNQRNPNDQSRRDAKIFYDKTFLKIAPFLFVTGKESVKEIIAKYKMIEKNDELIAIYMEIIDNLSMSNKEYIRATCPKCEVEDTIEISFPAWRNFFKKFRDQKGYFTKNS